MATDSAYDVTKTIAGSEREGWLLGYIGVPWPIFEYILEMVN